MGGGSKITMFDAKSYDQMFFDQENQRHGFNIRYLEPKLDAESAAMAAGSEVVCVFVNDSVDAAAVDRLVGGGTRLLALRCAGYNNVDFHSTYGRMHVVRVPEYSPYAVAEHAVALMMTLNRKTHRAYFRVKDNNFSIKGLLGFDMRGRTAGVVGTGRIGRALVEILLGFGMRVLAFDTRPDPELAARPGFRYAALDEIYAESDVISLHCPLTKDNHHMIDEAAIAKMRRGVMLVNTSRGGLVDTAALVEGLKSGQIGHAGLDVYEEESEYFFEDKSDEVMTDDTLARLNSFNNVLITSHQAFFTREAMGNIAATTLGNVADFLAGRPLANEICYHCGREVCRKKTDASGRCF